MGANERSSGEVDPEGPTLYLESGSLDPTEAFCTEVFDDVEGEYRVVQLTATKSFESIRDALDVQLERITDPSEAAVIITTPQSDDDASMSEVGEGTPLYGFRVNPRDLTGISVAFSRIIEKWEESDGTVKICLRDLESLLPYHDADLVYRFLNTVLATLQGAGAEVHVHLSPSATDEQTLQMLRSLFARVVEPDESPLESSGETAAGDETTDGEGSADGEAEGETGESPSEDVTATTMSPEAIDSVLESEGHGVLAFGGDGPYAVPMSFGYDPDERVLYLHLSAFEGSEKQSRLVESDAASLVVSRYDRPDRWHSVVIDGTLSQLSSEAVEERGVYEVYASGDLASVDVFSRDTGDVTFDWYVLEPTEITGRRSVRRS